MAQKVRESSSWSLYFDPPGQEQHEWASLEDGLEALLDGAEPLKDQLRLLGERFSLEAYCGHFGSGFGGGPSISSGTLGRLSSVGLRLTIKVYWSTTEPDE
jgi:hypothetical protein